MASIQALPKPRNGWGGARPGAGRPRKPPTLIDVGRHDDPKAFLLAIVNCEAAGMRLRIAAAVALMPYLHRRASRYGPR